MRLSTVDEIKNDILVKLGETTTTAFYTDDILEDWIDQAHTWAVLQKKWPFTEGRATTTYASDSSDTGFDYFEGWRPDSIRLLQVGGKRMQKISFEDYQIFREERPSADDRVYTDHGQLYFINPNADVSGTTTAWGQFMPVIDVSIGSSETVFSNRAEDGNIAIVNEVLSYAYAREKQHDTSNVYHAKAIEVLEGIWQRYLGEQYQYHTKDRSMWKRFDVLDGGLTEDLVKRDQF